MSETKATVGTPGKGSLANDLAQELARTQAECDALRKDAERYRWLRERHWHSDTLFVIHGTKHSVRLGTDCPSLDLLDAAIDAAIAQERGT